MFYFRCLVLALACSAVELPLPANAFTVDGDEPRKDITVHIQNESIESVLRDLSTMYGFEMIGLSNSDQNGALTTTMSGSLEAILRRLLRNRNHVLVRSTDNRCGIQKVILQSESGKSSPASQAQGETPTAAPGQPLPSYHD